MFEFSANGLLSVFSMDLAYFERAIPFSGEVLNIIIATGWALLLGNLVFQAAKSMMSSLGFESDDPKQLFARTFVFGFLLLASRQICEIGLGISNTVITLLQIPTSVNVRFPDEFMFSFGASWLLTMIGGLILVFQVIKLFFAVGERYFLVGLLTVMAPWAFAMGGSRNTADIFKGWVRTFASMCLMMVLNVIFLKMLLSAMGYVPSSTEFIPWLILIIAIARVGRKIDALVARVGMSPVTGSEFGRGLPGMMTMMVVRSLMAGAARSAGAAAGGAASGGTPTPPGGSSAGNRGPSYTNRHSTHRGGTGNTASHQGTYNQSSQTQGMAGTPSPGASPSTATPGMAGTPSSTVHSPAAPGRAGTPTINQAGANASSTAPGMAGTSATSVHQGASATQQVNTTNTAQNSMSQQSTTQRANGSRRSSVPPGSVKPAGNLAGQSNRPVAVQYQDNTGTPNASRTTVNHPGTSRPGQSAPSTTQGAAGKQAVGSQGVPRQARNSAVPPDARVNATAASGVAGTVRPVRDTGGTPPQKIDVNTNTNVSNPNPTATSQSPHIPGQTPTLKNAASSVHARDTSGSAARGEAGKETRRSSLPLEKGKENAGRGADRRNATGMSQDTRRSSVSADKPKVAAGTAPYTTQQTNPGAAGTESRRTASSRQQGPSSARDGGKALAPPSQSSVNQTATARTDGGMRHSTDSTRMTKQQPSPQQPGAAGTRPYNQGVTQHTRKQDSAGYKPPPVVSQGTARLSSTGNLPTKAKGNSSTQRKKRRGS